MKQLNLAGEGIAPIVLALILFFGLSPAVARGQGSMPPSAEAAVAPAKRQAGGMPPGTAEERRLAPASKSRGPETSGDTDQPDEEAESENDGKPAADGKKNPFSSMGFASHGPITITSDKMDLDYQGNHVTFTGNVHAAQQDSTLVSDKMVVTYGGGNVQEIKTIVATGNVRIDQGEHWATGDKAVLNQVKHTIEMTGSPIIHQGQDQIAGTRILIYTETQKSYVENAKAVIFPHKQEDRNNKGSKESATDSKESEDQGS